MGRLFRVSCMAVLVARVDEVLLSKQGTANTPGASGVQFEIRVRWKS